ncbi:MAG TPA: zf-HC2 domain-containing protein [Vicinamibacterales bacterium]|nr:zf-HC2 domain-containing protein [Vicinamibacterales bacterium]
MIDCELVESPDVELYFYGELDPVDRARVDAHIGGCEACRQRLEDLHVIRRALALRPAVDAPPAADWSGFMRRLDASVGLRPARAVEPSAVLERTGRAWSVRHLVTLAAMLAIVAIGVFAAARFRAGAPAPAPVVAASPGTDPAAQPAGAASSSPASGSSDRALREGTAEHLERSKLVVLGLAARDPSHTRSADWQYERRLAGTLLTDTRLYRQAATERGASDVAHVMRDLETVLIEASMSDGSDRDALERVQRLITKRDLVVKMQVVAGSAGI